LAEHTEHACKSRRRAHGCCRVKRGHILEVGRLSPVHDRRQFDKHCYNQQA